MTDVLVRLKRVLPSGVEFDDCAEKFNVLTVGQGPYFGREIFSTELLSIMGGTDANWFRETD